MDKSLRINSIHDLISMFEGWEQVQELAEHLSGVRAQLIDSSGKTVSGREFLPDICRLIQSTKVGESRCRACYEKSALTQSAARQANTVFRCHAGLDNIVFPLSLEGVPAGAIACGRVLSPTSRPDDREFHQLAMDLGVDAGDMERAVGNLAAVDSAELNAFAKVLQPFVDAMGATIFRYFSLIEKSEDLITASKESEGMLSVDRMTGLYNRRYFDDRAASEVSRANRYGHPIALVMFELDHFDSKTDAYGLIAKDIIFREVAEILTATARATEVVVRYDDTHFAVIMPECDHEQAFRFAERVRKNIAVKAFGQDAGLDIALTASIGVAALYQDVTVDNLVERAENALTQARNDGGNKIRLVPLQNAVIENARTAHIYVPDTTKKRRVVVTGMGLVTPIGNGRKDFWEGIKAGKKGASALSLFDPSKQLSKVAAEVKGFDPSEFMPAKDARRMDRFAQFAVAASKMAVEDSGLSSAECTRMGVRLGTNVGGIGFAEDQHTILMNKGPGYISPFLAIAFSIGSSSSQVSLAVGAKGTSLTVAGECTSGASAIAGAYDEIIHNGSDVMLAGGAEAPIRPIFMSALDVIRLLSTRNDDPTGASRPFDLQRDGLVIGEGSAMIVLEELEHARKRNANIYGELLGYGMTCDSYHIVQPDPNGTEAIRATKLALESAGLGSEDIEYINAHGSSTQLNDTVETKIIKTVFGDHAKRLPVSGTKAMTGHAIGAIAAMEFVTTIMALKEGFIPATVNYTDPDPDCDLDFVPNHGRIKSIKYALSNSFGFGGKNTILAAARYDD